MRLVVAGAGCEYICHVVVAVRPVLNPTPNPPPILGDRDKLLPLKSFTTKKEPPTNLPPAIVASVVIPPKDQRNSTLQLSSIQ